MSRPILAALGVLVFTACQRASPPAAAPVSAEAASQREARIERVTRDLRSSRGSQPATLAERMEKLGTPAVSIAVVDEFRLDWARGFGVKEWGESDAVDEDTLFQAASISKPVFALAVMRMLDAGRLDLDVDVNSLLRTWQVPPVGDWQPHVTLRQLLSHSAATTVHGFLGYRRDDPLPTITQILNGEAPANSAPVRVLGLPGLSVRYSGGGTTIAQLLVSDVLSQPFAGIMHDWLLGPLEMRSSTYAQPLPDDGPAEPAAGHLLDREPVPGKYRVHPELAAAGLWTTPSDLARAMLAVMQAAAGREDGPLPARWIKEMLTPRAGGQSGLGFFLDGSGENLRFSHGGANVGYRANFVGYAQLGKGAIVMINSEAWGLIDEILGAIAREYAWPAPAEPVAAKVKLSARALQRLAGVYRTGAGMQLDFRAAGDSLQLVADGQPPLSLIARSDAHFAQPELGLDITFHRAAGGRVERVSVSQPDSEPVSALPQKAAR